MSKVAYGLMALIVFVGLNFMGFLGYDFLTWQYWTEVLLLFAMGLLGSISTEAIT